MVTVRDFYVGDTDPMYVQELSPGAGGEPRGARNAVFVHGGAHSGVCWTSCPDARPGWAVRFADAGWTCHVLDWPGVGRSPRGADYLSLGARVTVSRIATLLDTVHRPVVVAHSLGVPLALKAIDVSSCDARAVVAVAPAAVGNLQHEGEMVPPGTLMGVDEPLVSAIFANARRFPRDAMAAYLRSLWEISPAIPNARGNIDRSDDLVIDDVEKVTRIASVALSGEDDTVTPPGLVREVADFLGAEYVRLGADWEMSGFGHLIPVEAGSELVADRLLEWLGSTAAR